MIIGEREEKIMEQFELVDLIAKKMDVEEKIVNEAFEDRIDRINASGGMTENYIEVEGQRIGFSETLDEDDFLVYDIGQEELDMIAPVGKMAYPTFVWNERPHVFDLEKVLEYYDHVTVELEEEYDHLYITFDYSSMSEAMYMSVRDNEENLMVISVRNHSNAQSQYDEVVKFCDHDNWESVTEAVKDIINKNF